MYALHRWDLDYEKAKHALFREFNASSANWPRVMWESSEQDSTDEHSDLPEVISRNIRHRIDPSIFDRDIIMGPDADPGGWLTVCLGCEAWDDGRSDPRRRGYEREEAAAFVDAG